MKTYWHKLKLITLSILFVQACTTVPKIRKEPRPWTLSAIPAGNWEDVANRGDRLGLISREEYIEIDSEEIIQKRIQLPQWTMDNPMPFINQDYMVYVYEDTSHTFSNKLFIELRSIEVPTKFVRLEMYDLVPRGEALLTFHHPVAAINDQNQLLLYFRLYQKDELQLFLFDIVEERSGFSIMKVKEITLPWESEFESINQNISAVGSYFYVGSAFHSQNPKIYQIDPKGEVKAVLSGESLGYFSYRDTLFAHVGGPYASSYLHFSTNKGEQWQAYPKQGLGPIEPFLVQNDQLLYRKLNAPGIYYSTDLDTGTEINAQELPDQAPNMGCYFAGKYYLSVGTQFYWNTSLTE